MASAQPAFEADVERIADIMIRLERNRDFKLTPIAVARIDGPEAHVLVGFPDRSRVDLTPGESEFAAFLLRMERPYRDYEAVARRFSAAATAADLAAANIARGYGLGIHEIDQHRVVPA